MLINDLSDLIRIRHVSELPEWFDLKKYHKAKTLTAAGWYEQLFVRYYLFYALERLQEGADDEEFDDEAYIDAVDHTFAKIQENPILDVTTDQQLSDEYLTRNLLALKQEKKQQTLGVRSLAAVDLFAIQNYNGMLFRKIKKRWKKSILIEDNSPIENLMYQPLHQLDDYPLLNKFAVIDWELPDGVLIEHFKQFLKTNRPETFNFEDDEDTNLLKKYYRKPDFNEWCRLSILPYLDLQFWALEEDIKIPNRVMADAIFPIGENGEETIRKTTAPLAKRLMNEESLAALLHQAALEIAERNNQ